MWKNRGRLELMQAILENCECGLGVRAILNTIKTSFQQFQRHLGEMERLGLVTELPRKKNVRLFKVTGKGEKFLTLMRTIRQLAPS